MAQKYKQTGNRGLFDEQETTHKLSVIGNPLEMLSKCIDFEIFRVKLEDELLNKKKKNNAGAKPFDLVMMLKIMILQRYYGLSDKQVEYQILDRTSFKQFLGLESGDKVPDEKTIWLFRENMTNSGLVEKIFSLFHNHLEDNKLIMNEGKMVDASFTLAPVQRNTPDENKTIKEGKGGELWSKKSEKHKKCHKDVDARWTKKNNVSYYGYKNHAKVDTGSKFIDKYVVTDASVHDSQPLGKLMDEKDAGQPFYADSAYTGLAQEKVIEDMKMINNVHEKGYKNKPLTDDQKAKNKQKSKTRVRVEHVFGFMEQSMKGLVLNSIGITRARGIIGLMNLTYNLFRFEQVMRLQLIKVA